MTNPVITNLPKVGIRPTIDGRLGGVRESLEAQTMGMAKSTAKLIASKLRYPTGEPVQCVIADTCIGGIAEAAACAEKFRKENVGVSLTVTPCWCYGSETMDADPLMAGAIRELREAKWERELAALLRKARKARQEIGAAAKSEEWKVRIAREMKRRTTATNPWFAEELNMGHPSRVCNLINDI
jgi:L-fucose isomerase-like protein